jgi:hypothetical protein
VNVDTQQASLGQGGTGWPAVLVAGRRVARRIEPHRLVGVLGVELSAIVDTPQTGLVEGLSGSQPSCAVPLERGSGVSVNVDRQIS